MIGQVDVQCEADGLKTTRDELKSAHLAEQTSERPWVRLRKRVRGRDAKIAENLRADLEEKSGCEQPSLFFCVQFSIIFTTQLISLGFFMVCGMTQGPVGPQDCALALELR